MKKLFALVLVFSLLAASCTTKDIEPKNGDSDKTAQTETNKEQASESSGKTKNENKREDRNTKKKDSAKNKSDKKEVQKSEEKEKKKDATDSELGAVRTGPSGFSEESVLNQNHEGKFVSFRVSKDWKIRKRAVNEPEDTTYFYMRELEQAPFLMYQFESVDPNIPSLTDVEWEDVFKNAQSKRLGTEVINGLSYQYGIGEKVYDQFDMLVYYILTKGTLQAFTLIMPPETGDKKPEYKELLKSVVNTAVYDESVIGNALRENPIGQGNSDPAKIPAEFDGIKVKGCILPVPKGWVEASKQEITNSQTIVYSSTATDETGMMYQYLDLGTANTADYLDVYIMGIGSTVGEEVEINGRKFTTVLPGQDSIVKFTGYVTNINGKNLSFLYMYSNDSDQEKYMELMRKVVDSVVFE